MSKDTSTTTNRHIIADAFVTSSGKAQLIGSRCSRCETYTFPKSFTCPNPVCDGSDIATAELSHKGRLASFTIIHYPPPPPYVAPDPFEPFAIGAVSFAEGIQIIGPMTDCDPWDLTMGMEIETVVEPYYTTRDGVSVIGWKFRPVSEERE